MVVRLLAVLAARMVTVADPVGQDGGDPGEQDGCSAVGAD
jgi:hypothetical protein